MTAGDLWFMGISYLTEEQRLLLLALPITPAPPRQAAPFLWKWGLICTLTHQQILCVQSFLQGYFLTEIRYFWPGSYCAGNQGEFEGVYMQCVLCTSLPWNKVSCCLRPLGQTKNKAAACHCVTRFAWQFSGLGFFVFFSLNCISKFLLCYLGKYNVSQIIVQRRKLEFSYFELPNEHFL